MSNSLTYSIKFDSNLKEEFGEINQSIGQSTESVKNLSKQFKTLVAFEVLGGLSSTLELMKVGLNNLLQPGADLNHNMAELSAITGVTGEKLKEIELNARETSKEFGINAAQQVESYKVLLSKLSPEIANNSEALKIMGDNVAVTSKLMGGDSVAATNLLTTAMNQFGVDLSDPIRASKEMADMMNIMQAAANAGSAELPQIQQALEQVGMVAKSTGVSFAETNAAIQVLDKAGKQGAEGGVALRNMLSILGEGRFMAKASKEGLEAYGISVEKLGDKNSSLTDRLRLLKPVMHDSALMSQIFGRENQAAAIALINGESQVDKYYNSILDTNAAYESSQIVMGSYQETMARMKAKFDDLKISIFNATQPALPFAQGMMEGTIALGQASQGVYSLHQGFELLKTKGLFEGLNFTSVIGSVKSLWATILTTTATGATGVSTIIANIPIIGWIAAAVAAIAALTYYLYNNSREFNEIIGGVWAVIKLMFGWLWDFIKGFFSFLWDGFKAHVIFIQWVATTIFNGFKFAFEKIRDVALWLWTGFKSIFGGVADLISQYVIAPISKAFDWLMEKVNAVLGWFKKILKPITDAYQKGSREQGDDFDRRKAGEALSDANSVFAPMGGIAPLGVKSPNASSIASDMIKTAQKNKRGDSDGQGGGNSVRSITNHVKSLVENLHIHTTTMEKGEQELRRAVTEVLLTILNDSNQQLD